MYFLTLWNSLGQTYLCFKVYKNISHQNYFFNKYFGLTKQKYTCPGAYFFSTICNCLCIKTKFHMLFIYWNIHSASENPTVLAVCTLSALLSSGLRDVALDRSFAWLLGNTNLIIMSFVTGPLKGFTELLTNGLRFGIFTVTDPRGHRKFLFFCKFRIQPAPCSKDMNLQRWKSRAWLQVLSFWAATERCFAWPQYILPNKYLFLKFGM